MRSTEGNRIYLPKIGWIRFYKSREKEGKIKQDAGIRVRGGVNLPRGIRAGITYQNLSGAYDFSRR